MKKFFISHSHKNKALANVLVSLLKDYYRIDINNITCTSDRNDITAGKEVKHYIWDCLNDETTYISVDLSKFPSQYLRDICEIDFVLWPSDLKKNTGRWQVCVEKLGVARNTSC